MSHNKLKALPGTAVFAGLRNLKFLYLHNNGISAWDDIQLLTALPTILHITLMNNPVSAILGYRYFLARSLKSLLALDNYVITDEERTGNFSTLFGDLGRRFKPLNAKMMW